MLPHLFAVVLLTTAVQAEPKESVYAPEGPKIVSISSMYPGTMKRFKRQSTIDDELPPIRLDDVNGDDESVELAEQLVQAESAAQTIPPPIPIVLPIAATEGTPIDPVSIQTGPSSIQAGPISAQTGPMTVQTAPVQSQGELRADNGRRERGRNGRRGDDGSDGRREEGDRRRGGGGGRSCDDISCPFGQSCSMRISCFGGFCRNLPQCVLQQNWQNPSFSSCSNVFCNSGFHCEMQQSERCDRFPCSFQPVCVSDPPSSSSPSCSSVLCMSGTICRMQTLPCFSPPCPQRPSCINPCEGVSCPRGSQCSWINGQARCLLLSGFRSNDAQRQTASN